MNTCDACKWWNDDYIHPEYVGDKICKSPKLNFGICPDLKGEDEACIHNSIDSSLETGPKFGCIHHQPKS